MKERKGKNPTNSTPQLDLFPATQSSPSSQGNELQDPKVISMADHRHQQEIKKFYDAASKLTSHLK